MNEGLLAIGAVLAVAVAYVVAPALLVQSAGYRGKREVRCPRAAAATIELDAWRAGVSSLVDRKVRLQVAACSEWPVRAGCDQACLAS